MKECPKISVAFQNNLSAAAAIATIGTTKGSEFITAKMFAAGTAMSALAINPYLIYKIAFFQGIVFASVQRYCATL